MWRPEAIEREIRSGIVPCALELLTAALNQTCG